MGVTPLRNKLKKSAKLHKIALSVGDAYVVAFHGTKRAFFFDAMSEIKAKAKGDRDRDLKINALTVAISLTDDKGNFAYSEDQYEDVIAEMLSVDIDKVVELSLDINGMNVKSTEAHKKK
jgi:hypothetical protein